MKIHVTERPQTPYTTIKYCCAKEIIKSTLQEYQITYSPISQPLFNRLAIELTLCMMRIFATYATNFFVTGQPLKVFYKKTICISTPFRLSITDYRENSYLVQCLCMYKIHCDGVIITGTLHRPQYVFACI
jgi:hypothetical protein